MNEEEVCKALKSKLNDIKDYYGEKFDDYKKLVKECDDNAKHLKPNKIENTCDHCYRRIVLPENFMEMTHRKTMESRKELSIMQQPFDFGDWNQELSSAKDMQMDAEFHFGYRRYRERLSLTKSL